MSTPTPTPTTTTTSTTTPKPPARPRHPQRHSVSFSDDHVVSSSVMPVAARMKWTAEMEARLAEAEAELDKSQKRWSRGQEEWLVEVERLLETKKEYKRFVRRREKMMQKEGRRVKGPLAEVAVGGVGSGTEDEIGSETSRGFTGLIRRVSSARSTSSLDSPTRITRANSMQSSGSEIERQSGRGFGKLFRRFSSK